MSCARLSNMKSRVMVIGGATWDVLFTTPEARLVSIPLERQRLLAFPYGGKLDAQEITYGFGGGGANVSVGLSRLGLKVSLASRVGNDWRGQEVVKNLRRAGIDTRGLQIDRREATPLSFVVTTGGARDHVAFVARGASRHLKLPKYLPATYSWAYITALAMSDWPQQLLGLFKSLRARKQAVFWNPGRRQLTTSRKLKQLLPYVTVLNVNREEAEYLVRDLRLSDGTIMGLLRTLHRAGAANVLMTEGVRGAHFYDGTHSYYHPALHVEPVNTTGAGDAFGSGFLAAYVTLGGDVVKALRWGMLNSTSVILQTGAQRGLLTLRELGAFERTYAKASGRG